MRGVLALIMLVVLGFGAWYGAGLWAISGTRVVLDAQPFECVGDEVTLYADDALGEEGEEMWRHAIELREGLDCSLRFHVVNDGWRSVALEAAVLSMMGPVSALPTATTLSPDGEPVPASALDATVDAPFALDGFRIDSEARQTFTARLTFNPDGCVSDGSVIIVSVPEVVVSAWGASRTVEPEAGELAFIGTADSSCER